MQDQLHVSFSFSACGIWSPTRFMNGLRSLPDICDRRGLQEGDYVLHMTAGSHARNRKEPLASKQDALIECSELHSKQPDHLDFH